LTTGGFAVMRNLQRTYWVGLFLSLAILAPASALAAGPKREVAKWDNLQRLSPGDDIRVVLNDKKSYRAKFQQATEDRLTVRLATGEQSFAKEDILRVSVKGGSHRLQNAAIGLGIGVGLGLAIAAKDSNDSEAQNIDLAFGVPLAGAGGAAVGALLPSSGWREVYRAR
jgi:hypothetical protein